MAPQDFQERLNRIGDRGAPEPTQPRVLGKARDKIERLELALIHLERKGVKGDDAYPPMLRMMAKSGVILRPPHYKSFAELFFSGFFLMTAMMGVIAMVCLVTNFMPDPVQRMFDAGPIFLVGATAVMAVIFAGVLKMKSNALDLPKWGDL